MTITHVPPSGQIDLSEWEAAHIGGLSVINVTDSPYNATGDGSTDDTAAVQAAIDDAATGGSVYFRPGTYLVTGLTVTKQVTLRGSNGSSYLASSGPISRLKLKAASTSPLIAPDDSGDDATGVHIADLVLDTNNIAKQAIYLADSGSSIPRLWTIERCLIVNSGFSSGTQGAAVYIGNNNTACVMRDCQLLSNEAGATTRATYGWDGVAWYGQDGIMLSTFIGCYADAGVQIMGGSSDQTLVIEGGGSFWNSTGVVVGGTGPVIIGFSIDHNYNDGLYAAYPFTAVGCVFHSNSLQTTNTWSHIFVNAAVPATIVGCRQAPQSGDAGANIAAYFLNVHASSTVGEFGNFQDSGATLGTGWTNRAAYSVSNVSTDRSYNANSTTTDELADVLGTLIADLQARKVIP